MKDTRIKEAFIEHRAAGMSFDKIASEIGVSKQTLINWSKEMQADLANAKTIARDSYLRRLELHEQGRLELLGEIQHSLKKEVRLRDLSQIPTDKLIELILKISRVLESTDSTTTFKNIQPSNILSFLDNRTEETTWEA